METKTVCKADVGSNKACMYDLSPLYAVFNIEESPEVFARSLEKMRVAYLEMQVRLFDMEIDRIVPDILNHSYLLELLADALGKMEKLEICQ